jgi:hypothetical protein
MSLKAVYERYLADPSSAALSPDVSLNYITTATVVHQTDAVIDHLSSQKRIVKKKPEKILSVIETPESLCLDIETTLEFVSGGGAYLPSLDENFLTDKVVTFPMVCPRSQPHRQLFGSDTPLPYRSISFVLILRKGFSRLDSTGTKGPYSSKLMSLALVDATGQFAMPKIRHV